MDRSYFINYQTVIGYTMMLIATGFAFVAVRAIHLKYVAVIESISYIYILLISILVFKEKVSPRKVIACGMIVLGIVIFSL